MVLDFVYPAPHCGEEDTRPDVVAKVHYTYYGQLIIVVTVTVAVVITFFTDPVENSQVHKTYKSSMPFSHLFSESSLVTLCWSFLCTVARSHVVDEVQHSGSKRGQLQHGRRAGPRGSLEQPSDTGSENW